MAQVADYWPGPGYGFGSGYGYGAGYGAGFLYGSGAGSGSGDGSGCGGSGCGDGVGSGSGSGIKFILPEKNAWKAFHYIRKDKKYNYGLSDVSVYVGQVLHEHDIELCSKGLHSSLLVEQAKKYMPTGGILTDVLIWGECIIGHDKIVSQYRKVTKIYDEVKK